MTQPTTPAARPCTWPACLTPAQQDELAAQVDDSMHGRPTTPMPDQRPICGCTETAGQPRCDTAIDTPQHPTATPELSPIQELRAAGWRIQGWADADPDDQFGPLLSLWLYRVAEGWGPPEASGPYDAPEALALARLINSSESR